MKIPAGDHIGVKESNGDVIFGLARPLATKTVIPPFQQEEKRL
jgi:hypothetical protein